MATRLNYRQAVKDKFAGIEESGYANFDYSDSELNTYLDLAASQLFPVVYRKLSLDAQSVVSYGTYGKGQVSVSIPESRIFMLEDATELSTVVGWQTRPGKVVGIPEEYTSVNIYYFAPFAMPSDDVTTIPWADEFKPLYVLAATIAAYESRADRGVRPDPSAGEGRGASLFIQGLTSSLETMKREIGMSLPVVVA